MHEYLVIGVPYPIVNIRLPSVFFSAMLNTGTLFPVKRHPARRINYR